MANASNDDGHPINRCSGKPLGVQNFKATNVRVSLLRIGEYQIQSRNTTHLTAKWYYKRQQFNWEILENGRKKKIEIDWSSISAIRVAYGSDPKILEIELRRPPHFYGDSELSERHTVWETILNFTDGQASTYRIHHLEFSDVTLLERNMNQLFILDSRLKESTERPFPSLGSPLFVGYIAGAPQAPLMNSQLLQHHQNPPDHSSAPTCSSNSNLVGSISTVRESASRLLSSLEDSQVSGIHNYGNPQKSSSLPRTGTIHDLEPRTGHSVPRSRTILNRELRMGHLAHNSTVSIYNPDNTSHSGLASSWYPHRDVGLGLPSSPSHRHTTRNSADRPPGDERHDNRKKQRAMPE